MQVDVLIIGQGICGTLLSWFLHKEGKTILVMDHAAGNTSSNVAAGVINPVTGRRYVTSWMAEELLPFAELTYNQIGGYLGKKIFHPKSIIEFFPTPQMRNTFVDRISENDTYLHAYPDQNLFNPFFHYEFGCGEIKPAYTLHMQTLLSLWREQLKNTTSLREERFAIEELKAEDDGIRYHDITAQKIIFCDGISGAGNPWFSLLPFSSNKGEAVIIECEGLNQEHIYKKGFLLVPLAEEALFWLGSNYQWDFADAAPTSAFYKAASESLQHWLKLAYRIVDHKAAVRPATVERRPFVGFHPQSPSVGILNGMGTKGASLAPFFAHQLAQNLVHGFPIAPEADVHRFQRILSKQV
jgi:glycine/D-amino acid oxidase-like deaminating enzyme